MKALVKSHAEGDDTRFYSVALQVAAGAARSGQNRFAQDLRDLVDTLRERGSDQAARHGRPVPVAQPRGELAQLLTVIYPQARLSDLSLDDEVRTRLERALLEQRQSDRLVSHGFHPLRRLLLLIGPPGTGKTMSAHVLAGELRLPLLKYFAERLPATFAYAGIEVEAQGLFSGVRGRQIAGRFTLIGYTPFAYGTTEQRESWRSLIATLESTLRLHRHQPGTLVGLADYLFDRTGGMIGSLSQLIRGAAILAVGDVEQIIRDLLDVVPVDYAATRATPRRPHQHTSAAGKRL
ncbi:AAA family ATPase [Actinokineospora sp. HUAS TT18]|uniref:AAA family ATPase n=1 Tax=Actinokineospora sp. HUAS TT18 TaxID=3447451 RepID=UPI003F528FEC